MKQKPENRQEELRKRAQQLLEEAKKQSRSQHMSTSISEQQLTEVCVQMTPSFMIKSECGCLHSSKSP